MSKDNILKLAKRGELRDNFEVSKHNYRRVATFCTHLTPREFKVLVALTDHADDDLWAYPTAETIAECCGFAQVKDVYRITTKLEKKKAIFKFKIGEIPDEFDPPIIQRNGRGIAYLLRADWAIREAIVGYLCPPGGEEPEQLRAAREAEKEDAIGVEIEHPIGVEIQHPIGVYGEHPNPPYIHHTSTKDQKTEALGDISNYSPHHCETSIGMSGDIETGILNQRYQDIRRQLGDIADDPACESLIQAALRDPRATPASIYEVIMRHIASERRAG